MSVDRLSELQQAVTRFPQNIPEPLDDPPAPQIQETGKKKTKKRKKRDAPPPAPPPVPKDQLNMESFFQQVTKIEEDLQKIERNCDAVDMAHQIIIHSVSEEEIKEQEAIIGSFMDLTNKASASAKGLLKSMDSESEALASQAPRGSGDLRMRRVKHAALVKKFSTLMKRFQEIQQRASSKHQAQIQRQYKISKRYSEILIFLVNPAADQDELDNVANTVGAMTLTSQQIFSLGQSRNPLETLERMKERRKDVMAIEKGIVVLTQID